MRQPLTLLSGNSVAGRLGLAPTTFRRRLLEAGLAPDAIVISGGKEPVIAFNAEALPRLRRELCKQPKHIS